MGSMMAPTVVGTPSSGSTLVAGMAMYSANAPSRSTPMMRVFLQMWLFPVRHWRQCPHTIRSEEHTSELQSRQYLVCRLLLEKKKKKRCKLVIKCSLKGHHHIQEERLVTIQM